MDTGHSSLLRSVQHRNRTTTDRYRYRCRYQLSETQDFIFQTNCNVIYALWEHTRRSKVY